MDMKNLSDDTPVVAGLVNIDAPRFDQSTFEGRAKHFFATTNPANVLLSSAELDEAKRIVRHYKLGVVPPGLTVGRLWDAKTKYDSAFHPDTGEKTILIGRMSAQVPMNTLVTAGMMTFYRSTPAVIFWQWVNQSFNAVVNYSNRSGDKPISQQQLITSYAIATSAATGTALGLNALTKSLPPIAGRLVPFAAVAAANCLNIPFMRQSELREGIPVFDENGNRLGESKNAASNAIQKVVVSRIGMATPGMVLPTFVMNYFDTKTTLFKRHPWAPLPIQLAIIAFCLTFATPLCCAAFPQKSSLPVEKLEPELQQSIRARRGERIERVYFNKGL